METTFKATHHPAVQLCHQFYVAHMVQHIKMVQREVSQVLFLRLIFGKLLHHLPLQSLRDSLIREVM